MIPSRKKAATIVHPAIRSRAQPSILLGYLQFLPFKLLLILGLVVPILVVGWAAR